jgi:hypothetical protein
MDQELKDFTWQELFFHVKEATRKDSKGNKDIAEKAEKYPIDTTPSSAVDSTLLPKTDTSVWRIKKKTSTVMKLTKKTSCIDKPSSTLDTDSSFDELLSKPNLQCGIKDKSTQEAIEKVDLEKQQDNTLDDTVDYNEPATVEKQKSKPIPEPTIQQ